MVLMPLEPQLTPTQNFVSPGLPRRPWYRRVWLWIVVLFVVVWLGLPLLLQPFTQQGDITDGTDQLTLLSGSQATPANTTYDVVSSTSPSLGPVTAPVTVVEFGDFQCPFCKEAEPILKQVLAKYPEAVRLIFRNLPLGDVHPEAIAAAEAAACAHAQDKPGDQDTLFWHYHDGLYASQDSLGDSFYTTLATSLTSLGLNVDTFNQCRSGHLMLAAIQTDFDAAVAAGAEGTPTFYVNGHRIAGVLPLDLWDKVITAALKEKFAK